MSGLLEPWGLGGLGPKTAKTRGKVRLTLCRVAPHKGVGASITVGQRKRAACSLYLLCLWGRTFSQGCFCFPVHPCVGQTKEQCE